MTRFATRVLAKRAQRAVDERGVTMIIFGLIIVALLIVVAIVIDLGNARQQKRQLQNAADAAALAGAHDLGITGGDPCGQAATFSYNNLRLGTPANKTCTSTTAGNVSITVASPYYTGPAAFSPTSLVNVKACKDVPTSFARIIGVTSIHVCGNATARKIGISGGGGGGGSGGGTGGTDPEAPCSVDSFTSNGYFDHDSHLQANPKNDSSGLNYDNQGMKNTSDSGHSGGLPGGVAQENDWVGATYSSTSPIDLTVNPPKFTLTNTTTNTVVVTSTDVAGYGAGAVGGPIYIKPMTSINGVAVPSGTYAYDIAWKVPSGNVNNAAYSISMVAYDSTSTGFATKCGKAQWQFTKGTVPPSGGTPCGENSFIGTITPAPGGTVHPNDILTVSYQDESPIYNPGDGGSPPDPNRIVFSVDGTNLQQAPLGTPNAKGPNSDPSYLGSTTYYTLKSPTSQSTSEKYSTDIQYKVPSSFITGSHTFHLKAYDSDNNKPGGDCGVADWTLNVSGGASNVELVQ